MKFGKRLQRLLEDSLPEWQDKFLSYKHLKQVLKLIDPDLCFSQSGCHGYGHICGTWPSNASDKISLFCRGPGCPEAHFIFLLYAELHKINTFFLRKEEDFIIRLEKTKGKFEKLQEMRSGPVELSRELIEIWKAIVNIHGEMVLLENYSALNFTGLVKIVKKHDKRTGGALRMPFIQGVLQEPFFATDIISKLVQDCEETLQSLFPHSSFNGYRPINNVASNSSGKTTCFDDQFPTHVDVSEAFVGDDNAKRTCRNTMAAWQIMREFRRGSSTYNFFSVPPFGCSDYDEGSCCKSDVTVASLVS